MVYICRVEFSHAEASPFPWGGFFVVAPLRRLTAAMPGLIILNQAGLWPAAFSVM
jgi:hypothetical protein